MTPGWLPPTTARLFGHYPTESILAPAHRDFLIGTLLERGDRSDLRWLIGWVGEAALHSWVVRRGRRGLTTRNLCFWCLLLGLSEQEVRTTTDSDAKLWPLGVQVS